MHNFVVQQIKRVLVFVDIASLYAFIFPFHLQKDFLGGEVCTKDVFLPVLENLPSRLAESMYATGVLGK